MFFRVHADFGQISEGINQQNATTIVSVEIEKDHWNLMVAGEPDDLDDYSFRRNTSSLVETQMMDMNSQLEAQTSIWDVTEKLKSKATLHSLSGKFKAICKQCKLMVKID